MTVLAYLPSPSTGVWNVGPVPVRAYALCILLGVVAAVAIGQRRWEARGGGKGAVADVATIAVPFGILGARIYHVVTSPERYLEEPLAALYVWQGGLGIPGGIAGGTLAAYVVCRRRGFSPSAMADACAPGVVVAQAIGRLGNWFNSELFGAPTTLPWGLLIDPSNPDAIPGAQAYHPTFLYELLWNLGVAALVVWADRRWRMGGGRVFALYVAAYAVGRLWIEGLRIDEANLLLGLRLNQVVMAVLLVAAVAFLVRRRHLGREEVVDPRAAEPADTTDTTDTTGRAAPAEPAPVEAAPADAPPRTP